MARPAGRTALKHLKRAADQLQQGAFQPAIREARLALKADPAAVDARAILGIARVQAGEAEAGLADLEAALAARPRDPQLLFNLGHAQSIAGHDAAARQSFEAALRLDPGNLPARMNLAHLFLKADDPKQAAVTFRAALNGAPGMVEAHLGLGLALQQQHRLEEAERAFREALRLAPGHPQALMNLGNLLIDAEKPDAARPLLEEAARQPGAGGDAWCNLAVAAYDCGDLEAALGDLDEALARKPAHTRALATKVIVLDELGRHDAAHALADPGLVEQHRLPQIDNAALTAFALSHPTLLEARSGKTTMMGQQSAQLHYGEDPALDALLQAMEAAGADYRARRCTAQGQAHPFLTHPPRRWQIVPWITVLRDQGHQDSHNHPSGWLSGVYYAAAPGIRRDDNGKTGWLELGRPHSRFRAQHLPALDYVCPEPGLLVLFPSFAWHMTVPFAGTQPRISIAFDLVPVDDLSPGGGG
ncbi:2OG-Fe(II) oxygenase family protein [Marinibaculum pumilum]|uniref:2OG-Fe(II) oxygenase family protein n=1 Tax=Marinibaculum pumilum TaxID=1766165 RepID=A0ABV7KWN9_9PROT